MSAALQEGKSWRMFPFRWNMGCARTVKKRTQRLNFFSGRKVLGTCESGGSSLYFLMKNRVQTAVRVWNFAENPSDKKEGDKLTRLLLVMEISEASFQLHPTDKLLHIFQFPLVRKTFKCIVNTINGLTKTHGAGVSSSTPWPPSPMSGPTPPFSLFSLATTLQGSFELLVLFNILWTLLVLSCLAPFFTLFPGPGAQSMTSS